MSASTTDVVTQMKAANTQLGAIASTFAGAFPRITGTFTLAAATTTVVTQPQVAANSVLLLTATNATAALTVRTLGIFHSANTPGSSFSVSTQNGAAAGTESFEYTLVTPA